MERPPAIARRRRAPPLDIDGRQCAFHERREILSRVRRVNRHRLQCLLRRLSQRNNWRGFVRVVNRTSYINLSPGQIAAVVLIRADHRTHTSTEEAARTRLGFLRLTKGGQSSSDSDRVLAELSHESFCRPRHAAVSGPMDALRQALVDRTLDVIVTCAVM
jgi:hypothetical protein